MVLSLSCCPVNWKPYSTCIHTLAYLSQGIFLMRPRCYISQLILSRKCSLNVSYNQHKGKMKQKLRFIKYDSFYCPPFFIEEIVSLLIFNATGSDGITPIWPPLKNLMSVFQTFTEFILHFPIFFFLPYFIKQHTKLYNI